MLRLIWFYVAQYYFYDKFDKILFRTISKCNGFVIITKRLLGFVNKIICNFASI